MTPVPNDAAVFFRAHRSALVRTSAVREIRAERPSSFSVLLASGARARRPPSPRVATGG